MSYTIKFKPSANRDLSKLSKATQKKISKRIDALAVDPRPAGVEKLKGERDLFRVRVGDYRIVYQIKDNLLLVLVVKVGHRKEIYRSLNKS